MKNFITILMGLASNQDIAFGTMAIFIILIILTCWGPRDPRPRKLAHPPHTSYKNSLLAAQLAELQVSRATCFLFLLLSVEYLVVYCEGPRDPQARQTGTSWILFPKNSMLPKSIAKIE